MGVDVSCHNSVSAVGETVVGAVVTWVELEVAVKYPFVSKF